MNHQNAWDLNYWYSNAWDSNLKRKLSKN